MFEVTAATAAILYLSATLAFLFGIWLFQHQRSCKRVFLSKKEALFVCEFCHFAYVADTVKEVTKCPQCSSYNKENRYKS